MKRVVFLSLALLLLASCAGGVSQESFDQLLGKQEETNQKLEKLTSQVAGLSGAQPSAAQIPAPAPTPVAAEARPVVRLFQDACSGCHGASRQGGTGPALIPQRLGSVGEEFLEAVIINGRPGTAMPPWKDVLKDEQVKDLIKYILSPVEAEALTWGMDDIKATREVVVPAAQLPSQPNWGGQVEDLMVVVERDIGNLMFVDSSTHKVIKHIEAGYAIHAPTFTSKAAGGRWLWAIARNGWLTKVDLYSLQVVGRVRVGLDSRGTAVSTDGRYVIAGNYIPNSAVIVDAETLEPLKVIKTFGVNPDGEAVESRVAALLSTPIGPYFEIALKEAGQVWVVDYSQEGFPVVKTIPNVGRILHDAFLTPDGRYYQVASQVDGTMAIIDLKSLEIVKKIPAGKKPHPGPGASFESQGRILAATPAIGEGLNTIWDTATWEVVKTLPTRGPGLFIRSNPDSRYVWVDVVFGDAWDDVVVFDRETLEIVKTLQPGKRSLHPEFTRDGRYVYVSAWNGNKVVVYDAATLEVVTEFQANTPTGIFSVGLRQEEPGA
jgi:mono/diheme cytochrome c family protein/DNA-binding beta-propeller fold protein YncE